MELEFWGRILIGRKKETKQMKDTNIRKVLRNITLRLISVQENGTSTTLYWKLFKWSVESICNLQIDRPVANISYLPKSFLPNNFSHTL